MYFIKLKWGYNDIVCRVHDYSKNSDFGRMLMDGTVKLEYISTEYPADGAFKDRDDYNYNHPQDELHRVELSLMPTHELRTWSPEIKKLHEEYKEDDDQSATG